MTCSGADKTEHFGRLRRASKTCHHGLPGPPPVFGSESTQSSHLAVDPRQKIGNGPTAAARLGSKARGPGLKRKVETWGWPLLGTPLKNKCYFNHGGSYPCQAGGPKIGTWINPQAVPSPQPSARSLRSLRMHSDARRRAALATPFCNSLSTSDKSWAESAQGACRTERCRTKMGVLNGVDRNGSTSTCHQSGPPSTEEQDRPLLTFTCPHRRNDSVSLGPQ